jgi:hypothetical protein
MPTQINAHLPKTINEAINILAYNDYFYPTTQKALVNPHPKDRETIVSLAEAQYPWTEKQGKLAVILLKRYLTKFQKHKMDIKDLLDNPQYENPFRKINFEKSIEKYIDEKEVAKIDLRFPYTKKLVTLVRCLKDKKGLPSTFVQYDGETKIWTFKQSDVTTYYLTLMAVRYDFKFIDETLLNDYDEVKKEIKGFRKPTARLVAGEIIIDHASESLLEYWNKNIKNKKLIQQVDALKNFFIGSSHLQVQSITYTGGRIAHHDTNKLWVDSNEYSRDEVVSGLIELDSFPICMPVTGDLDSRDDIEEMWHWLKTFERNGIDLLKEISWGFDVKDLNNEPFEQSKIDRGLWENRHELMQMSKQFKYIDQKTKVIIVRNRIPRSLIKSKIKPRASLTTLGGGYYQAGNDNLKRFLENLPKKLYYSTSQPSNWDWTDKAVIKL